LHKNCNTWKPLLCCFLGGERKRGNRKAAIETNWTTARNDNELKPKLKINTHQSMQQDTKLHTEFHVAGSFSSVRRKWINREEACIGQEHRCSACGTNNHCANTGDWSYTPLHRQSSYTSPFCYEFWQQSETILHLELQTIGKTWDQVMQLLNSLKKTYKSFNTSWFWYEFQQQSEDNSTPWIANKNK
jgi:hypothetical protein